MEDKKRTICIFVDDLRVGGIQRLALDEAYGLCDMGFRVVIFSRTKERKGDSILALDSFGDLKSDIIVECLPEGKIDQIRYLSERVKSGLISAGICHSPSMAAILKITSLIRNEKVKVILWIHQVLSLSNFKQAAKRVLFACFADKIYFSSVQFKKEWESNRVDRIIRGLHLSPPRGISRLGVYVSRVLTNAEFVSCQEHDEHLVFVGRPIEWKGLGTFMEIASNQDSIGSIILTVNFDLEGWRNGNSRHVKSDLEDKIHVFLEKPPSSVKNMGKMVHLYPTNYGPKVKYNQAIGLNVLEFAVLGIPSLVSEELISTYPELYSLGLAKPVNWSDKLDVQRCLEELLSTSKTILSTRAAEARLVFDIGEHLETVVAAVKEEGK